MYTHKNNTIIYYSTKHTKKHEPSQNAFTRLYNTRNRQIRKFKQHQQQQQKKIALNIVFAKRRRRKKKRPGVLKKNLFISNKL